MTNMHTPGALNNPFTAHDTRYNTNTSLFRGYEGTDLYMFDTGIIILHISSIGEMLTKAKPTDTDAQLCQALLQRFCLVNSGAW